MVEPIDAMMEEEEERVAPPKSSSKEELMSLLNLLRLYHGSEVGEGVRVALKLKRGRLGRRQTFKTRKDWLQGIKMAITQSSDERRESQAREAEMKVERQNDLARLKLIRMQEEDGLLLQENESKSEMKKLEASSIDPGLRKEKLVLAARQLERQKLALILLLQDATSLTNSRA